MTHLTLRLMTGAALSLVVCFVAYRARSLTLNGALAAFIVGTTAYIAGPLAAGALLIFFMSSSGLSRWRKRAKDVFGFEKTGVRDGSQVAANGGLATLFYALSVMSVHFRMFHSVNIPWQLLGIASLAEANADTWATEIGSVLGRSPRSIVNGRLCGRGESGAVSVSGLVASIAGALVVSLFAIPYGHLAMAGCMVGAVVGALFDSVLGATLQAQWLENGVLTETGSKETPPWRGVRAISNDIVNFMATVAAALVTWLFIGAPR